MPRAPKSDSQIDRLYQVPLGEFIAARNGLARETGAAAIKALQKPSLPAWAINQLYWRQRSTYDEVTARAEDLRATHLATQRGKRADLRGASRDHEQAVDAALKATLSLLAEDGQPITDATRQAIATTLRGLPGEEAPGRLTRPLEPRGFDMLAAAAAGAGRVKPAAPAAKAAVVALPAKADRKASAEERAAERERLAAAREALVAATRATRIAEQAARREEFEAARAARDAEKAQQRVKDAEAAVEDAQEALAAAERDAAAAAKTRDAATERVKRAGAELAEMKEREEKARRAGS